MTKNEPMPAAKLPWATPRLEDIGGIEDVLAATAAAPDSVVGSQAAS